jgi:hypothetical protein
MSLHLLPARVAALGTAAVLSVSAQTVPLVAPTDAQARPMESVPYRSAFENYRSFTDEKIQSWKQANDTVGQIGGWRAYAKEAHEDPAKAGEPEPAGSPGPAAGPDGKGRP